ncbi:MAG: SDR family NAD(P)-dependent oxidoreductase [Pirellulaceae bacterium]
MSTASKQESIRMRFQDRVVIVTGGAMGIGGGCCEVFAREGGRVAVIDRDAKAAQSRLASLPGEGHRHWQVDVADAERLEEVIHQIAEVFGRIDLPVPVSLARKRC